MHYVLIGVLFALVLSTHDAHQPTPNTVDFYATGKHVTMEGVIADEPDRRPLQIKYTVAVESILDGSGALQHGITGRVLVTDRVMWPLYQYGDRVRVAGILKKPGPIEDFRYDHYLSRYDIYAVLYRGSITPLPTKKHHLHITLRRFLYSFKERFEQRINLLLGEPHASFMAGLLTGSRRGIPKELMEDFHRTGLTHIIAISGYNITIVIAFIASLLFFIPPHIRFLPIIIAIITFTIFVGASAAVVRAAIMGILGLLALQTGRLKSTRLLILWTALLMTTWNPKILYYDAGFQLSFLAVIGITEFSPLLDRLLKNVPRAFAIRESLQMTIAAQIATAPLIVLLFGRLSLIAPLTNVLVAPVIPLAMLLGTLAVCVSTVSFPLGQLIAYLAWACLEWIILIARMGAALPLASIPLNS